MIEGKDILYYLEEEYNKLVNLDKNTSYRPQLNPIQEVSQEAQVIFTAFDNIIDQLSQLSHRSLTDAEKNTLYNYLHKGLMPALRRVLRGGVMERIEEENGDK